MLDRLPQITLLPGERNREFVLSHAQEDVYLTACPQPLRDVALLMLDTGLRQGEALALDWDDVFLTPANKAKFGYLRVREGGAKKRKRNLSLTSRVKAMLKQRKGEATEGLVFGGILGTSLDHEHLKVRNLLKLPKDFVMHGLRHTMLTRLGEAGADAFTIMKIAGHSSVTTSQRYVHPSPESLERAFERLEALNDTMSSKAGDEADIRKPGNKADHSGVTTVSTTPTGAMPVTH